MEPGEPSRTAVFVAYLRALGNLAPRVPGFSDAVAETLLPAEWATRVEQTRSRLASRPKQSPFPFGYEGLALFSQFRTAVLDQALRDALPFDQLVVLGAGLDGRAWRLPGLENVRVFEVDLPGTQAWKRAASTRLPSLARELRFIPVDFTREALTERLPAEGYEPGLRTFWLWEGVAMYLRVEDIARTLSALARLSSPGSRVAMSYLTKVAGRTPDSFLLSAIGEPCRSAFTPAEREQLVAREGWTTIADSGIQEWRALLAPDLTVATGDAWLNWNERVWVGRMA